MRPPLLYPLFAPVTSLPGVGPRFGRLFGKLTGEKIVGLIWHLPTSLVDRSAEPPISAIAAGQIVTLRLQVAAHLKPRHPKQPYRVSCVNPTGSIDLVFFSAKEDYLKSILPVGAWRAVSGRVEIFHGEPNMPHPDHILPVEKIDEIKGQEATYALTAGLSPRLMAKAVKAALTRLPDLPEWIDPAILRRQNWPSWKNSLLAAHRPQGPADLDPQSPARQRLAYDELLANQMALELVRRHSRQASGRPSRGDGRLTEKLRRALPYRLTSAQIQAIDEIAADMAAPTRMLRLLQGDVGSGKTVVALAAMLIAREAGGQAALLAPTDLLARQHFANLKPLAAACGIEIALLTGREKSKARDAILTRLADGTLPMVVGTHALVQEGVAFADLRLAVIDEQHRFGVEQRLALAEKGRGVDLLVMTATPIPRSLMLTAYGDIDVSRLHEKPPGRQPIATRTLPLGRLDEVVAGLRRAIAKGAQAYWVCPLIEESETSDLAAAADRQRALARIFGDRVGLLHGRMKGPERDAVMSRFLAGDLDILVATTVIEVGLDVPRATIMIVEQAERFGLAQLHQLRGRVGRGEGKSSCLLLYRPPLGAAAKARLAILRETEDGFRIAEEDLRQRGAGELLGTRQSGLPDFRLADLGAHGDLIALARNDAKLALERDHNLTGERGKALTILLYLFERDAAVKTLRSG